MRKHRGTLAVPLAFPLVPLVMGAALLTHLPGARAQCWVETAEVPAPHGNNFFRFGSRVALQGDLALASSHFVSDASVHLFQRDLGGPGAWGELKELFPSSGDVDGWGASLSIDGDLLAVGHLHSFDIGEVFLFQRDQGGSGNWGEIAVIAAFDGTDSDVYGSYVSLSGTTLAVGAPGASAPIGQGAVYIYEQDFGGPGAWGQVAKLVPNSALANSYGRVALAGDTLVVAPQNGPVEVFERDLGGPGNWGLVTSILVPPVVLAVDLCGDTLALGLPREDVQGVSDVGKVFLFERDQGGPDAWGQTGELTGPALTSNLEYGYSIALQGDRMVVGALFDNEAAANAGAAHVHERDQGGAGAWGEVFKLTPPAPAATDHFGGAVGLDGETTLIGSDTRNDGFPNVGALAHAPDRKVIFGATGTEGHALISLDPVTGDATFVGSTAPYAIGGLAYDLNTGTLYGSDYAPGGLVTLDPDTGAPTWVGLTGFIGLRGLAFDPNSNTLYGSSTSSDELITIDTITGVGTAVGPLGLNKLRGLAFDPDTNTLYGTDVQTNQLAVIDTVTGVGSPVGPLGFGGVSSLALHPTTGTLSATDIQSEGYLSVDIVTGAATSIVELGASGTGVVFFYDRTPFDSYCTAGTSASGCQALIQAAGVPSATKPSGFTLAIPSLEGDKNGFYLYGTNGRQANSWGSGTSFICVIPPRLRGGLQDGVGTPGLCDGYVEQDLNERWCPTCPKPAHNPGAGAVMQAQYWYRDPQNTSNQTSSLSDAIEFTFCP